MAKQIIHYIYSFDLERTRFVIKRMRGVSSMGGSGVTGKYRCMDNLRLWLFDIGGPFK